jgi:hypothetical protein
MRFPRAIARLLEIDESKYHPVGSVIKANVDKATQSSGFLKSQIKKGNYLECDPVLKGCKSCGSCPKTIGAGVGEQNILSRQELGDILAENNAQSSYGKLGEDDINEMLSYTDRWVKTKIPLDRFPNYKYLGGIDKNRSNTLPIVTNMNEYKGKIEVLDGKHRVASAKARGEKYIDAYIPFEHKRRGK